MKKLIIAIMALTVIFAIAACSKKEEDTLAASSPSASATASATPAASASPSTSAGSGSNELKITATNWKFDSTEYKVKAGETYKVTLVSNDGVHGVKGKGELKLSVAPNKTVEYKFDKPGTYEIECSIPCGPDHAKMKAKIVVEA